MSTGAAGSGLELTAPGSGAPEPRLAPPIDPPPPSRSPTVRNRSAAKAPGAAPPERRQSYRFVRAYWTTFVVIGSYLWFAALSRFFGKSWADNHVADVHARNARRVERTIVELQGLFIKVGQLLSHHGELPPGGVPRRARGPAGSRCRRGPTAEIAARIEAELRAAHRRALRSLPRGRPSPARRSARCTRRGSRTARAWP